MAIIRTPYAARATWNETKKKMFEWTRKQDRVQNRTDLCQLS